VISRKLQDKMLAAMCVAWSGGTPPPACERVHPMCLRSLSCWPNSGRNGTQPSVSSPRLAHRKQCPLHRRKQPAPTLYAQRRRESKTKVLGCCSLWLCDNSNMGAKPHWRAALPGAIVFRSRPHTDLVGPTRSSNTSRLTPPQLAVDEGHERRRGVCHAVPATWWQRHNRSARKP